MAKTRMTRRERLREAFPVTPGVNHIESVHDPACDTVEIRLNGRRVCIGQRTDFYPECYGGIFVDLAEEYFRFNSALALMEALARHISRNGGRSKRVHSRGNYRDDGCWPGTVKRDDERYRVYICRGRTGALYIGISTNPVRRIREHNTSKRGAKWARSQRPVKLLWFDQEPLNKSQALKFERKLKKLSRKQKLAFIKGDLPVEIPV